MSETDKEDPERSDPVDSEQEQDVEEEETSGSSLDDDLNDDLASTPGEDLDEEDAPDDEPDLFDIDADLLADASFEEDGSDEREEASDIALEPEEDAGLDDVSDDADDHTEEDLTEVETLDLHRAPAHQEEEPPEEDAKRREDPDAELRRQVRNIELALEKTQRAIETPLYLEGALWYLTTSIACLLSALLFALLFTSDALSLVPAIIAGGGVTLATIAAASAAYAHYTQRDDILGVARLLQRHVPDLRHDLVAALKFGWSLLDGSFDEERSSAALARAHVKRASTRASRMLESGHLGHLLPKRDFQPAAWAFGGALVLLLIPTLIAPAWVADRLMGEAREKLAERAAAQLQTPKYPVLGNLSLKMQPPGYTGLQSVYEPFTTGNAKVLGGTEITIKGYSLLGRAEHIDMIITQKDQEPQIRPMELARSGRASTTLVLTETMNYTFRAKLDDGTFVDSPTIHRIEVTADKAPTIEIVSHKGELQVGTDDVLELEFAADDDFGITGISRLHAFLANEEPAREDFEIPALQNTPPQHQGTHTLDLKTLGLQPKDRVTLYLEVTDNNTLTGPGVGRSQPLVLVVASPDDKHMKLLDEQKDLVEELLLSLADFLEAPVGRREHTRDNTWRQVVEPGMTPAERLTKRKELLDAHITHGGLLVKMDKLATRMQEDPLMAPRDLNMFVALHKQLVQLHERGKSLFSNTQSAAAKNELTLGQMQRLATWSMESEEAMEKGLLRLEDLLLEQQMASAKATAKEIEELKQRLRELLLKYKETGDPELKEAIKREIQRLRQRMQELMQRMNQQMRELPQEHINREALQQARMQSDAKKLADNFTSIEEMLDKGDIDGALEQLEQMGNNLDEFTKQLDKNSAQAAPQRLNKFDEKVSELMDDVNDLSMRQQALEQETRDLQKQLQEERRAQNREMLEDFTRQMQEKVRRQKRELENLERKGDLPPHLEANIQKAKSSLRQLEESLEQRDIESSLDHAQDALEDMEKFRFSLQTAKNYTPSKDPEYRKIEEAMRKSRPMLERSQQIVDELDEMMSQADSRDQQQDPRTQELAEKQQGIKEQARGLRQKIKESSGEYPQLEQELGPGMERAQRSMDDAKQALDKERSQRALDSERQAIEELRQMNDKMKEALQRQRQKEQKEGNNGELDEEKVEIPGASDGGKKSRYRDEIKDTMKEERLDGYESEIERYYKSLVK